MDKTGTVSDVYLPHLATYFGNGLTCLHMSTFGRMMKGGQQCFFEMFTTANLQYLKQPRGIVNQLRL
jgi:hypothetical protein